MLKVTGSGSDKEDGVIPYKFFSWEVKDKFHQVESGRESILIYYGPNRNMPKTVKLTVKDSSGATDSKTITINPNSAPSSP